MRNKTEVPVCVNSKLTCAHVTMGLIILNHVLDQVNLILLITY